MVYRHSAALLVLALACLAPWAPPPPLHAQGVEVFLNVTGGGARKLNIAIPEFTVVSGTDPQRLASLLATVAGKDLTFSGLFSVVASTGSIPLEKPAALQESWSAFAAAGAHAGVHGLLTLRGQRLEAEMRLYDLTSPAHRLIATKKFDGAVAQARRVAHKIADEIVLQFTGELGIANTKLAFVMGPKGAKEIYVADYDGAGAAAVTRNGSINLSPVWSPDTRSLAFTSFVRGYPDLYRAFPFERRPVQTLSAFPGINSSPAWSPDGRSLALTLSKDGNPELYVLNIATGALRRLTRHGGIDTEPTWSPTGRQIAFISDRTGTAHLFVMDTDGTNIRQLTTRGFHTQPRWSPKGDLIVYTQRQDGHQLWAVNPDGSDPRQLTFGPGDAQAAAWAPDGRHLAFQSSRLGRPQIFVMPLDGTPPTQITSEPGEATSPSWSPRLP